MTKKRVAEKWMSAEVCGSVLTWRVEREGKCYAPESMMSLERSNI